jgi:hypothetical protein
MIWFSEPKGFGDPRASDADWAARAAAESRWQAFRVLVYPLNPDESGSLSELARADGAGAVQGFPFGRQRPAWVTGFFDLAHYRALVARLPVQVDVGRFRYHGGAQLADCARQYGYTAVEQHPAE